MFEFKSVIEFEIRVTFLDFGDGLRFFTLSPVKVQPPISSVSFCNYYCFSCFTLYIHKSIYNN